jgi:hypothetical protein
MKKKNVLMMMTGFVLVLILSSCASIPPASPLEKGSDTATVYFILSGTTVTLTGGGLTFGAEFYLWDSDTFISSIGGKEYIAVNFKAGNHNLMASGDNWYITDTELAPGKTYFFELTAVPGYRNPNVLLHLMEQSDSEIEAILAKCKEISPKGKVTESMVKDAGKKLDEAKGGSEKIDVITADKGR